MDVEQLVLLLLVGWAASLIWTKFLLGLSKLKLFDANKREESQSASVLRQAHWRSADILKLWNYPRCVRQLMALENAAKDRESNGILLYHFWFSALILCGILLDLSFKAG